LEEVPVRLPPDIAIEGISPSESASKVERKRMTYLKNGVKEVWLIYADEPHIVICTAVGMSVLEPPASLATPLLPGWSLSLVQIFSIAA
jgi:Uma2 family endonuclease